MPATEIATERKSGGRSRKSSPQPLAAASSTSPPRFLSRVRIAHAIVLLVLVSNAIGLWPELSVGRADLNDNVFHFTLIERMAHVVEQHGNPLDFWSPEWSFGYPVMRTYQPLPHLLVVSAYFLLGKTVSLMTVFLWIRYLAIVLMPLTFFVAGRLMTFEPMEAAAIALVAPLVSTNYLYGLEYGSYIWAGNGLFTQSVSCHFLLLALGFGFQAIHRGRRQTTAGILLGCALLSHFIYGYIGAVSLGLMAVLPSETVTLPARFARLAKVAVISFFISAFELIPLFRDGALINHSRWEMQWKWDSFGAGQVLKWLFTGELLDHGRVPVLSVLVLGGITALLWRWRRNGNLNLAPERLFVISGAGLWLLVFFGRPFWGPALALLAVPADMPLHRAIGGLHLFLILLAGLGLGALWRILETRRQIAAAVVVTILLLYPALRERAHVLESNRSWGKQNLTALAADSDSLDRSIADVKARGGRVYPGLAATWGGKFKIGYVPMYAFLSKQDIPAVAFLYHSMALPGDVMVQFNDWSPAQYRLFNIRSVIAPDGTPLPPFLVPRERFGRFQIFEAPGAGYFDVVDVPAAVKTSRYNFYDINLRWLQSAWPAGKQHLLLNMSGNDPGGLPRLSADAALPASVPNGSAGTVTTEQDQNESYQAQVNATRASFVLFRMTWHPNWHAYVDGRLERTVMLSPGFVGIPVTAGSHQIVCRYEPGPWKPIMALGGIVLAIAFGSAGKLRVRAPSFSKAKVGRAIAAFALLLPVCVSLFTNRIPSGHDALEYLPRQIEFHQNVAQGILFPQWAPDLVYGAGEPLFEFNPPMIYYIAEVWHLLRFDFVTAINLACVALVVLAATGMFLLGRLYFGEWGGWLAAAAYLYAPYFAVNLYVRSALAEFAAFPFYGFALYGFGAYAKRRHTGYLLLGTIAYAGVMFSHNVAALTFTPLLIGFVVLTFWDARSWSVLRNQVLGIAGGLGLSAAVWIPALAERKYVGLDRLLDGYLRYSNHFVFLHQLFSSKWGYGISVPGDGDDLSFSLGWCHLILVAVVLVVVLLYPKLTSRRWVWFFGGACVGYCFFALTDSQWIWDRVRLLQYLQFPWRMLGAASLCIALLIAAIAPALQRLPRFREVAFACALGLLIVPNLPHDQPVGFQDVDLSLWRPAALASDGINVSTASEYVPRWVVLWPKYSPDMLRVVSGDASAIQDFRSADDWEGKIRSEKSATAELSVAWFPGWQVRIDGHAVSAVPNQQTGLIRFEVPPGDHRIAVRWTRTWPRALGATLSIISMLVLLALACFVGWHTVSSRSAIATRDTRYDVARA